MRAELAADPGTGAPLERAAAPAVLARGLGREFDERPVLRDVSFALGPGETLAVLGPNGAGKSTLLRMLATLLRPSAGALRVLGAELPREAWRARGRIGLLAHEPLLYEELTAAEALGFHARLHGVPDPGARIADLLAATGLERLRGQRVRTLSAGERRRLAVCRCVLARPELLLLDEPEAHLDPAAAAALEPLIGRASGATRVVVSHDVAAALAGADRALVLDATGRVAYEGPAAELAPERARAVYAGGAP